MSSGILDREVHELLELVNENESWSKGRWYKAFTWTQNVIVVVSVTLTLLILLLTDFMRWALWYALGIFYLTIGIVNVIAGYKTRCFMKAWDAKYHTLRDNIKTELANKPPIS